MNNKDFEAVMLSSLPSHLARTSGVSVNGGSIWAWLHRMAMQLTPELPVLRVTLPNKKLCVSAQSSINGSRTGKDGKKHKWVYVPKGYHFYTRSEPVASKDGEYFLYIGIEEDSIMKVV